MTLRYGSANQLRYLELLSGLPDRKTLGRIINLKDMVFEQIAYTQ